MKKSPCGPDKQRSWIRTPPLKASSEPGVNWSRIMSTKDSHSKKRQRRLNLMREVDVLRELSARTPRLPGDRDPTVLAPEARGVQ